MMLASLQKRWQPQWLAISFLIPSVLFSNLALAENNRSDYDLDDNGLIEINDLSDLDEIRNNLDGKTLYGSNAGCPDAEDGTANGGCKGFELTTDLDFDTNQDGIMDEQDTYWNEGKGWSPIGDDNSKFIAILNGNGYQIRSLFINRPSTRYIGILGHTKDAQVLNLALTGPLMSIKGDDYVSALIGYAKNTSIRRTLVTGSVRGDQLVGGLTGYALDSEIRNSLVSGLIKGSGRVGGLAGYSQNSQIQNNLSTAWVKGDRQTGGVYGDGSNNNIQSLYWTTDLSGQASNEDQSESDFFIGITLETLQCAIHANTTPDNSDCLSSDGSRKGLESSTILYKDWDDAIWDFGASNQLPGLKINGKTYRDSDGDGGLDEDDTWPNDPSVYLDHDNDGHPDAWVLSCDAECINASNLVLDQFPNNAEAAIDTDLDGLPDAWISSCDTSCQENSGLVLDTYPNDSDNDGRNNNVDSDENGDGITDVDANSNGLIEIDSLEKLNAIRFQLDGAGLRLRNEASLEQSGCPLIIYEGTLQPRCHGYELNTDLDFDTNQDGTMDELDTYWNESNGWLPIGRNGYSFTAILDGNGHQIRNLFINRKSTTRVGLLSSTNNAQVKNLILTGPLMSIKGYRYVGGLIGYASDSSIERIMSTVSTEGDQYVGGLIGIVKKSNIRNSFVSGSVKGAKDTGGIAGYVAQYSQIQNSLSTAWVKGDRSAGGIVGFNNYRAPNTIQGTYWATDLSGQANSDGQSESDFYIGLTLTTLQCAIQANTNSENSDCLSKDGSAEGLDNATTLFKDWNNSIWDFGTKDQLPGLKISGKTYRDSDGDGALDADDLWPQDTAAFADNDGDGYPEVITPGCDNACYVASPLQLDQFPNNPAAAIDKDLDGLPDAWISSCDTACQENSGLVLDASPNDSDNDGQSNDVDNDDNNDGITDIDVDTDGLVDIDTLEKLNAMRFQLDGAGLRLNDDTSLEQSGCPHVIHEGELLSRCHGYELTSDLDFDTNQDGIMDEQDVYWNDGQGWLPIGNSYSIFAGTFEGNGHQIRNLFIDRPSTRYIGLLGYTENAQVQNLALTGPLVSIKGRFGVGGLIGFAASSNINQVIVTIANTDGSSVGGLVGYAKNSKIRNSFVSGSVKGIARVGGVAGEIENSQIQNSLSTAWVKGSKRTGGIVGYGRNITIQSAYWATDLSGQQYSVSASEDDFYIGLTLAILQCATQANTTPDVSDCLSTDGSAEGLNNATTLFKDWDNSIWDFGTRGQLPGLKISAKTYRDRDGDGAIDADDLWPQDTAAFADNDGDGYPEVITPGCDNACYEASPLQLDQFPNNPAAGADADLDGLPDIWADNCDASCKDDSGLVLDDYTNDSDNDGQANDVDSDDNNDGITDIDVDTDGLVDIDTLEKLNAMRFQLDGAGLRLNDDASLEQSGCPHVIHEGELVSRCHGYELKADLDFDSNQDGIIDELDTYWDEGKGWLPIGGYNSNFTATFEGNGHQIRNLFIDRPTSLVVGLFQSTENAQLQNLILTGQLMSITGSELAGALVGVALNTSMKNMIVAGSIIAKGCVGGIAGKVGRSEITNSFTSGTFESTGFSDTDKVALGDTATGGLIGCVTYENLISDSLSTAKLKSDSQLGGAIGLELTIPGSKSPDTKTIIKNTHWASDIIEPIYDFNESEADYYVGLSLSSLQCAVQANTNPDNSDCLSTDGSAEGLDNSTILFKDWENVFWDFGTSRQLPGLKINGNTYRDSDGDGQLDRDDALPFDTDNDGVENLYDTYPFISLDGRSDNDSDGIPDICDTDCLALGLSEDLDDDNDGVADTEDLFPFDGSEHSDFDGDGIGDVADNDDDNDGVVDAQDDELGVDNGQPSMTHVPDNMAVAVNSDSLTHYQLVADQAFFNGALASDIWDAELNYHAHLNGDPLQVSEDGIALIPSGENHIAWTAEDDAGNISEPMLQVIKVYPRARFSQAESIIGEASTAEIKVELTGDSPEYPVQVALAINDQSETDQTDFEADFSVDTQHIVTIEAGDDAEQPNRQGILYVPVRDDEIAENEERLMLDLEGVILEDESQENLYAIDENHAQHALTVTYRNLAPQVQLKLEQAGKEVANVQKDGGLVTITALVTDGNGQDEHTLAWDLNSLGLNAPIGRELSFDPLNLPIQNYEISVAATDNGINPLSHEQTLTFEVVEPPQEDDGGSGGGSLPLWFVLGLLSLLMSARQRSFKR